MDSPLFSELGPLSGYLSELERLADRLVDEMAEDELLSHSAQEHVSRLERQLMPVTPTLLLDRLTARRESSSGESFLVVTIPFSGSGALFAYAPSQRMEGRVLGAVSGALRMSISLTNRESDAVELAFWDAIDCIERSLRAIGDETAAFHNRLFKRLTARLESRSNRVRKERVVAEEVVERLLAASRNRQGSRKVEDDSEPTG